MIRKLLEHYLCESLGIDRVMDVLPMSSLHGPRSIAILYCLARTRHLSGDTAEIGVNSGGTSRMIRLLTGAAGKHWACETFKGLVDVVKEYDHGLTNGLFQVNRKDVEKLFEGLDGIEIVEGYFPESAPEDMKHARYKFVHIDVDTYHSTLLAWDFFRKRMLKGGCIVIDDALSRKCGANKFWNELDKTGLMYIENAPQVIIFL